MEKTLTTGDIISHSQDPGAGKAMSVLREIPAVAVVLGVINFFANYLLSPFFGVYEDDYVLFLPSQTWGHHQLAHYLQWCFAEAPQGRPIGWVLNALLGYATRQHSLEAAYAVGWLILTLNAVLLYFVLKRASNWFAALIGSATYLVLPVDLSKMILMHRGYVHCSMTFLLIGLLLYTSGGRGRKVAGFVCAAVSLTIWEGFFLPFLVAPLLEAVPAKKKWKNLIWHTLFFVLVVSLVLGLRYAAGEQRVTAMAGGGMETVKRMIEAMVVGPWTGLSTFVLRPIEVLFFADTIPKVVGLLLFCAAASAFLFFGIRLNSDRESGWEKACFLSLAAVTALIFPYILMFRSDYFPANIAIGRLSCCHAPAAFGYASLTAALAYVSWLIFRRFRRAVVLLLSLYLGSLVAFGIHVQETEYVEGWNNQQFVWRRIIAQCPDVREGMTILLDTDGLPASQGFGAQWPVGAAEESFRDLVQLPVDWSSDSAPRVDGYFPWSDHELKDDTLVLKSPSWAPKAWPTIKDGNFIFLRFKDGDLRRVTEPVALFGKEFQPKPVEEKPPLKLTNLGENLLGTKNSSKWPWFSKALYYPTP